MSDARKIRVGVVGASPVRGWATAAHLPALLHLDDFKVTAVATTDLASAEETAGRFGVPSAFAGASGLVSSPDVDLVVVSVKSADQAEVIRAAVAAGKHVLSEWPLGADLGEAAELARMAADAGVVHAVGLQGYHTADARFVKGLLDDGRIGAVQSVALVAAGDPLGGERIPPELGWSTDPAAGTTLLTIMVGHNLATLDHLVGEPADVSAVIGMVGEVPGQVSVHGRLVGGAVVSVTVQGGGGPQPDGFFLRIAGTDGALTITPARPGTYLNWGGWRVRVTAADGTVEEPAVPADQGAPEGPAGSVAPIYREIAAAIREGRPAHPGFDTAVRHHRRLAAIRRAAGAPA